MAIGGRVTGCRRRPQAIPARRVRDWRSRPAAGAPTAVAPDFLIKFGPEADRPVCRRWWHERDQRERKRGGNRPGNWISHVLFLFSAAMPRLHTVMGVIRLWSTPT